MSMLAEVRSKILRLPWVLSVLVGLGACAPNSHSEGRVGPATAAEGQHVPGELLVQFRPGVAQERIADILSANELRIERNLGMPLAYLIKSSDTRPVHEIIARLRSYPEVISAEPNRLKRISPPLPAIPAKPAPNG